MINQNILTVDDDASIRDILEQVLSRAGYKVFSVATGEEALQLLEHNDILVMFIDLGLETMTGFDLCEQIRAHRPHAILYAITGYAKLLGPHEILKAGFNDYIAKPFSIEKINQAVEQAFKTIEERANQSDQVKYEVNRILLIDDDDQFRMIIRKILEAEGFDVSEAANGEEGVERQTKEPADLVITDIIMPKKNGIETILEIMDRHPKVKFITVSGGGWYGAEIELAMAQQLGAIVLEKPLRRETILEAIEQLQN
jgi:DNA-binding NtrC family response regulator